MKSAIKKLSIQLPDNAADLAKFVLFNREKLVAMRANIRALNKLDIATAVRVQKMDEAQDIAAVLLDAEVRLGELFAGMEATRNRHLTPSIGGRSTKYETIRSLGFADPEKTAHRFELMAKHKDIVERVKLEAVEDDDIPTRSAVLRQIAKVQPRPRTPDLPVGKYRVIYADPPWKYSDELVEGYGAAEHHYPTMTLDELCALPVRELAADNAVLFLWVTSPLLDEAVPRLIEAWGFDYKTSFIWDKVRHNYGHYNSVRHEFLLVCTHGSCLPDSKELHDSVVSIERTDEHSEKPAYFRDMIDRLYVPNGRVDRIELFARGELPSHWKAWGNESD
jgi:N6-adenosine-specific RNA methylase IME4